MKRTPRCVLKTAAIFNINGVRDRLENTHIRYHIVPNETPEAILLDFSLTVKAATLIFISGCAPAISSAKEGKSGFIYNLVKS